MNPTKKMTARSAVSWLMLASLGAWTAIGTFLFIAGPGGAVPESENEASTVSIAADTPTVVAADSGATVATERSSTALPASTAAPVAPPSRRAQSTGPAPTDMTDVALATEPAPGWGAYEAGCSGDFELLYGARTTPKKFEYVVCVNSEGQLRYHGIDVASGSDIRLRGCLDVGGRFVFAADDSWRYIIGDSRRTATQSGIDLHRSSSQVAWSYPAGEEWGLAVNAERVLDGC